MRLIVLGIAFLLVMLPTLLILFAGGKPLRTRIFWALFSFLSPILTFALVQMMPMLTNNSPFAAQWERFIGVILSASGFLLPWILFAVFLHEKPRTAHKAEPSQDNGAA